MNRAYESCYPNQMDTSKTLSHSTDASYYTLAIKDPGSALTHFIGAALSVFFTPILLRHFMDRGADSLSLFGAFIFMLSMILLYSASTSYHTVVVSPAANKIFKKIDHMMIFVLIAGTYTPICLTVLRDSCGPALLIAIWSIAFVGILFKAFWVTCPKWVSSMIYISMGWLCIFALPQFVGALAPAGFGFILAGGIIYTLGGVIYAMKFSFFNSKHPYFGSHEIFHLFVMAGNLLHFIAIYNFLL